MVSVTSVAKIPKLKVYTENQYPSWTDPANIHNQMYQFDVVTDKVIHGIMQFDAKWFHLVLVHNKNVYS